MGNPFPPYWWGDGFNPPIGSAFDEAISYQQQMRLLYKDFHSTVDWLKSELENLIPKIEENTKEYVNRAIEKLTNEIDARFNEMGLDVEANTKKIAILRQDLVNFMDATLGQIDELRELNIQFNARILSIENQWIAYKSYINGMFEELSRGLTDEIHEAISYANGDAILVTNPVTAIRDTLKRTLNAIYNYKNPYPLYASSLNRYDILCSEWNKLDIKAKELNDMGGLILLNWWGRSQQLDYLQEVVVDSAGKAEKAVQDVNNLVPIVEQNTSIVQGYEDRLKTVENDEATSSGEIARLDADIQINTNNISDNANAIITTQSDLQSEVSARTNLLQRFEQLISYGLKPLWHKCELERVYPPEGTSGTSSFRNMAFSLPNELIGIPLIAVIKFSNVAYSSGTKLMEFSFTNSKATIIVPIYQIGDYNSSNYSALAVSDFPYGVQIQVNSQGAQPFIQYWDAINAECWVVNCGLLKADF